MQERLISLLSVVYIHIVMLLHGGGGTGDMGGESQYHSSTPGDEGNNGYICVMNGCV